MNILFFCFLWTSGLMCTALGWYYGNSRLKRFLGIISTQCRYCFHAYILRTKEGDCKPIEWKATAKIIMFLNLVKYFKNSVLAAVKFCLPCSFWCDLWIFLFYATMYYCDFHIWTTFPLGILQVIGAVGFMNQRPEIPKDVDPGWASLIEICWHRCAFSSHC